jgi:predicted Rossmann fold flavoprotein
MDLIVIGAGAAGLATALFAARTALGARVICLDGARHIGAKILVSGGSRCNVTNRVVTERDFWGGSPRIVRRVLRAFPAERAAGFFADLGVALHEEEDGKLFPDTNRSRTVLEALMAEAARVGVIVGSGQRVVDVRIVDAGFDVLIDGAGSMRAPRVVLATGGKSLPKTGSDGFGYELAARLGHGHVPTTPALAPLVCGGWSALAGVSHPAAMLLRVEGRTAVRLEGPMLWTHFGASGPLALNMSRHWHRAQIAQPRVEVLLNVCPGDTFESLEAWLREQERRRPRAQVATVLATRLPAAVADACLVAAGMAADATMAHLAREERRALLHTLTATVLPVTGSRGYAYAEATAGGVPLEEIDPATMESRIRPGLHFVGEMLDVDGRLGGFNFQWAWSSGWVAGTAIGKAIG